MEQFLQKTGRPNTHVGTTLKRRANVAALRQSRLRLARKEIDEIDVQDDAVKPQPDVTKISESSTPRVRHKSNTDAHVDSIKKHKEMHQRRIQFKRDENRSMSPAALDSEDEEFQGTQLAPLQESTNKDRCRSIAAQVNKDILRTDDGSETHAVELVTGRGETKTGSHVMVHSSSDSEEDLITPLRRRQRYMPTDRNTTEEPPAQSRAKRKRNPVVEATYEARDLDHKLIKTSKYRHANKSKHAFKSNLERLRRKKAGLPSEDEDVEEDEDDDIDDSLQQNGLGHVETDTERARATEPIDWIVHDEEEVAEALPAEFQQPRQPLEQFKIAVQWEILDLLMPQGGLEPDGYFKSAIQWLLGQTSGKFQAAVSSIWRRTFIRAVQRGPEINAVETGNLGFYCDACGRTNRIATFVVKFQGARYDHMTLEDLPDDADSSEDDLERDENATSDTEVERARKDRILRSEWNLGINCYERACVAHELFHLRKHLREEIHAKLSSLGLFSAAKKAARAFRSTKQRVEFANQVTEQLDSIRFQQRLWTKYKATIDKNDRYIVDPGSGRQ